MVHREAASDDTAMVTTLRLLLVRQLASLSTLPTLISLLEEPLSSLLLEIAIDTLWAKKCIAQ